MSKPLPLPRRSWLLFWLPPPASVGESTRQRVVVRLIPFLFFLYILAYLDRVNVSVAQLGMTKSPEAGGLGLSSTVIGFGAGLFFWGYWILEIPSTLSVLRWGARWVFARILVLWGLCCTLIGFIGLSWVNNLSGWLETPAADGVFLGVQWLAHNVFQIQDTGNLGTLVARQYCLLRFLLGFFEGGFFPSVILYLSLWFRTEDRAKAVAAFMAAIPASSLIGSPISGLMLQIDWGGLAGWRWIFILQGLAPIAAGFVTFFYLPDRPQQVGWLPPEEKAWLIAELEREAALKKRHGHWDWLGQAGTVLLMTAFYFCINATGYGLSIFMPKILQSQLHGLSDTTASLLAALPFVMGLIGMLVNGWHSDRTRERIGHAAVPLCCLSLSLFLAAQVDGFGVASVLIMIFLVGTFLYAHQPAFWPIPSMFLGTTAAASAIGFINMTGNLGGFVGPAMMGGYVEHDEIARGLAFLSCFPLTAAIIIVFVGWTRRSRRKPASAAEGTSSSGR
jgi:sugar phosphate permease